MQVQQGSLFTILALILSASRLWEAVPTHTSSSTMACYKSRHCKRRQWRIWNRDFCQWNQYGSV